MAREEKKLPSRPLSLSFSEWFVVQFFLLLILSLIIIAKYSSWKAQAFFPSPSDTIWVEVSGEVIRPGKYEMPAGSSCGDLLKKISLKRFADPSGIDPKAPVSLQFIIPRLEHILVRIGGLGIESQELLLPSGTRACDLKGKISLPPNSDLSLLRSRRMLADGEVVWIENLSQ